MNKIFETLKGLLQKGNALLGKLPFKGLAEKYIPAEAKAKVPFLETIVTPYANQIVAGLAALLLVAAIGGSGGGGGGSGSSLNGSRWVGDVTEPAFNITRMLDGGRGPTTLPWQYTYVFSANSVRQDRVEFNANGNRVNQSSDSGTYTVDGNIVSMTFGDRIIDGILDGSTLKIGSSTYHGNIEFKPAASRSQKGGSGPTPESDFTVTLTSDNAGVVINKYTGRASRVNIPAKIQGLPVRELAYNLFTNNIILTSIVIPEGITKIPRGTFEGCTNLSSVTLPSTLTSIDDSAFKGCSSLTSITLPAGLMQLGDTDPSNALDNDVFRESGLTSFPDPWPKAITVIPYGTFYRTNIRTLTIPEGITEIESAAFGSCKNLTSVTLPSSLTKLDTRSFSGCSNLDLATQARLRELGHDSF